MLLRVLELLSFSVSNRSTICMGVILQLALFIEQENREMGGATQQEDVAVSDELLRQELKQAIDHIATLQQQLNQLQEDCKLPVSC